MGSCTTTGANTLKRLVLLFLLLSVSPIFAQGSSLLDSLVAYYKLHERSGDRRDIVGSIRGIWYERAQEEFHAHADAAENSFTNESFSMEGWSYIESWHTSNISLIISKWDDTNNSREYILQIDAAAGATGQTDSLAFRMSDDGTDGANEVRIAGTVTDGEWFHWVVVHDASGNTIKLYINGAVGANASKSWTTGCHDGGSYLAFGAHVTDTGTPTNNDALWFDGRLDGVRFYRRALSSAEIQRHYKFVRNHWQLDHYGDARYLEASWDCDELPDLFDSVGDQHMTAYNTPNSSDTWDLGIGNHLGDNNTVDYSASGAVMNAADFDASVDEYLAVADNPHLSHGNEDFTIAFWANHDALGSIESVISKWTQSSNIEWGIQKGSSNITSFFVSSNGTSTTFVSSDTTVRAGEWFFNVAWHNATTDSIYFQTNNGNVARVLFSSGCNDNTSALHIGRLQNATSTDMDGLVDAVGVWRRVLTAAERDSLYNSGNGREFPFNSLGDDLAAHYELSGHISGTAYSAINEISQSAEGIDQNTVTQYTASTVDNLQFGNTFDDTPSEYLAANAADFTAGTDITVIAWFRIDDKTIEQRIVSKVDNGFNGYGFMADYSTPSDRFRFLYRDQGGGAWEAVNANNFGSPSVDTWYMLAGTYNNADDTLRVSINAGNFDVEYATYQAKGDGNLRIGAYSGGGGFDGKISSISFYRRALSDSEVDDLYNSGSGLGWPFIPKRSWVWYVDGSSGDHLNGGLGNLGLSWDDAFKSMNTIDVDSINILPGDTIACVDTVFTGYGDYTVDWGSLDGTDGKIYMVDSLRFTDGVNSTHPDTTWTAFFKGRLLMNGTNGDDYFTFIGINFMSSSTAYFYDASSPTNHLWWQCKFSGDLGTGSISAFGSDNNSESDSLISCLFTDDGGSPAGGTGMIYMSSVSDSWYIVNNTIYTEHFYPLVLNGDAGGTSTIENNIIYAHGAYASERLVTVTNPGNVLGVINYNHFYDDAQGGNDFLFNGAHIDGMTIWADSTNNYTAGNSANSSGITDPQLININGTATIDSDSPAWGNGKVTPYTDPDNPSMGYYQEADTAEPEGAAGTRPKITPIWWK